MAIKPTEDGRYILTIKNQSITLDGDELSQLKEDIENINARDIITNYLEDECESDYNINEILADEDLMNDFVHFFGEVKKAMDNFNNENDIPLIMDKVITGLETELETYLA